MSRQKAQEKAKQNAKGGSESFAAIMLCQSRVEQAAGDVRRCISGCIFEIESALLACCSEPAEGQREGADARGAQRVAAVIAAQLVIRSSVDAPLSLQLIS